MSNNTTIQAKPFSQFIQQPNIQGLINQTLSDPIKAKAFQTAVVTLVANNPKLGSCEPASILKSAFIGESLNLSPAPQLGQYYIVPYKDKATFQLGYKGYLQLAIRSGQYKRINVVSVKEGELIKFDPFKEEIEVKLIEDFNIRSAAKTIGYYACFKYLNGFEKAIYMSVEEITAHAKRYSKTFSFGGFWKDNFDEMASKTVLRLLLSKWGVFSVEMATAIESDEQEPQQMQPEQSNIIDMQVTEEVVEVSLDDL